MKIEDLDIQKKVQELLLNRLDRLTWTYFDLDLNEAYSTFEYCHDENIIIDFFRSIESSHLGSYNYNGNHSEEEVLQILFTIIKSNPHFLKDVLMRLFDINEIKNQSASSEGILGKFNEKDRARRNKIYKEKIREGHRVLEDNVVILAEGDSWFQFPRVYLKIDPVKDILDWLIEDEKYAVYSLAAGGDWLSNIFYSGEYIEELPKVSPDVFMLSGGGNDLVGGNRLATMVINPKHQSPRSIENDQFLRRLFDKRKDNKHIDKDKYLRGLSFISNEFFTFINLYFVQYFVFLYSLTKVEKYKKMMIITHGYDFALPSNKSRGTWLSIQRILNEFTDSGHWLYEPLNMKGITDAKDQDAVVYTMIYEYNEMLIQLAKFSGLPNLFHIDCRGYANEQDWFDELHLKSKSYEDITKVYKYCITQNLMLKEKPTEKVYRVVDFIENL